jgi:hypothetical protein
MVSTMSQTNFDVAALRSFVIGMDLGSFAKAAAGRPRQLARKFESWKSRLGRRCFERRVAALG